MCKTAGGTSTLVRAETLSAPGRVSSTASTFDCNYLKVEQEVMTSRQHISYKIFFGARGLYKFPALRQIDAHNHGDL